MGAPVGRIQLRNVNLKQCRSYEQTDMAGVVFHRQGWRIEIFEPEIGLYFNTSSSNSGESNNPPLILNGQNYISPDISHVFF